jgi:hypothetical protein
MTTTNGITSIRNDIETESDTISDSSSSSSNSTLMLENVVVVDDSDDKDDENDIDATADHAVSDIANNDDKGIVGESDDTTTTPSTATNIAVVVDDDDERQQHKETQTPSLVGQEPRQQQQRQNYQPHPQTNSAVVVIVTTPSSIPRRKSCQELLLLQPTKSCFRRPSFPAKGSMIVSTKSSTINNISDCKSNDIGNINHEQGEAGENNGELMPAPSTSKSGSTLSSCLSNYPIQEQDGSSNNGNCSSNRSIVILDNSDNRMEEIEVIEEQDGVVKDSEDIPLSSSLHSGQSPPGSYQSTATIKTTTQSPTTPSDRQQQGPRRRHVSFHAIEIAEHPYELGDNPSVRNGCPIQLGWLPQRLVTVDIDTYEGTIRGVGGPTHNPSQKTLDTTDRTTTDDVKMTTMTTTATTTTPQPPRYHPRRNREELRLPNEHRVAFALKAGATPAEVQFAIDEAKSISIHRRRSIQSYIDGWDVWHYRWERTTRKLRKVASMDRLQHHTVTSTTSTPTALAPRTKSKKRSDSTTPTPTQQQQNRTQKQHPMNCPPPRFCRQEGSSSRRRLHLLLRRQHHSQPQLHQHEQSMIMDEPEQSRNSNTIGKPYISLKGRDHTITAKGTSMMIATATASSDDGINFSRNDTVVLPQIVSLDGTNLIDINKGNDDDDEEEDEDDEVPYF